MVSSKEFVAVFTVMPKPDKGIIREGNYSSISLINEDVKVLNEILSNQVQQHIKKRKNYH